MSKANPSLAKSRTTDRTNKNAYTYLNHSFQFFGQPSNRRSAKGAPQLAHLSTKSHIGRPTNGRKSAVQKPQKTIQSRATLIGFTRTRIANAISKRPMKNKILTANSVSATPNFPNQPTQSFLPCKPNTPC